MAVMQTYCQHSHLFKSYMRGFLKTKQMKNTGMVWLDQYNGYNSLIFGGFTIHKSLIKVLNVLIGICDWGLNESV